jgi:hypothetical protein
VFLINTLNEDVEKILNLNDVEVNEFVLSSGTSLYLNQDKILQTLRGNGDDTEVLKLEKDIEAIYVKHLQELQSVKDFHSRVQDELRQQIFEEQKSLVIEKNKYFTDMKTSFDEEKAKILEETEVLKNQLKSVESELHRHKRSRKKDSSRVLAGRDLGGWQLRGADN